MCLPDYQGQFSLKVGRGIYPEHDLKFKKSVNTQLKVDFVCFTKSSSNYIKIRKEKGQGLPLKVLFSLFYTKMSKNVTSVDSILFW